jgi:hypothetical protein
MLARVDEHGGFMNSPHAKDLRAVPRLPGETIGPLRLRAEPSAESFLATVRDVSIQGIGLIANRSFDSGTTLIVEAGPSGKGLATDLRATVRHATALPGGLWLIGCSFSRHLVAVDFDVLG